MTVTRFVFAEDFYSQQNQLCDDCDSGVFRIRLWSVVHGCKPEMMVGSVNNPSLTINGENNIVGFPAQGEAIAA